MSLVPAHGYEAVFKDREDGHIWGQDLLFWQECEGRPVGWFLGDGELKSAESMSNFAGYREKEGRTTGVVGANPGWWVVHKDTHKGGAAYWEPVLAWLVTDDGHGLEALTPPDREGTMWPWEVAEGRQFIYAPSQQPGDGPWPQ